MHLILNFWECWSKSLGFSVGHMLVGQDDWPEYRLVSTGSHFSDSGHYLHDWQLVPHHSRLDPQSSWIWRRPLNSSSWRPHGKQSEACSKHTMWQTLAHPLRQSTNLICFSLYVFTFSHCLPMSPFNRKRERKRSKKKSLNWLPQKLRKKRSPWCFRRSFAWWIKEHF